jgi:suppressor for copper-sensitivity B
MGIPMALFPSADPMESRCMRRTLNFFSSVRPSLAMGLVLVGILSMTPAWVVAAQDFGSSGASTMVSSAPSEDEEPEVVVSVEVSGQEVERGGELILAVVLDHAEHYHSNLNEPIVPEEMGDFYPVPTTIKLPEVPGLSFGPIAWPTPIPVDVDFLFTGKPIKYLVYTGKAVIYVPVQVGEDAPLGELAIELKVTYQACNETTCLAPTTVPLVAAVSVVDTPVEAGERSAIFDGYDPARDGSGDADLGGVDADESFKIERRFLGLIVIPEPDSFAGIAVLALSAAIGGFILNLTPCVLPVIPIKVMTISNHAGESKSKAFMLSMWMAIGVVTFWVGIGIPVAFVARKLDPSIIFGIWWLTAIIGIVIALMGLGIMGLFQITLPQKVYMVNPKADSASGSFVFGIMTAVLGLPCFGFVAGALLAGAATMPSFVVLTVFAFMGIGMATPYVVLAMFPKLIDKLPRTGPASELVKQVMGLLMIAAAAYFLGTSVISFGSGHEWVFPWWGKAVHWWAIGITGVAAGGWLLIQTVRITKRVGARLVFGFIGLFIALSGSGLAYNQTNHLYENFVENLWQPFSPEFLESTLADGNVVVLDFTAEWCLNCKALEAAVLSRAPVKPALLADDVVAMVADLTSMSAPGWDFLRDDLGQTGIPLLVVYAPGVEGPIWLSNAYSPGQVVDAISRAREQGSAIGLAD